MDESHLSQQAYDRLREELEQRSTTRRKEISGWIERAREHGDIRENADYDAARDEQAMMEARIRHLQHMIKSAVVQTSPATTDVAGPGIIVSILEDGETDLEEYLLASTAEEKVAGVRTITLSSPLGSALLGKKVGESVEVAAPGGKFSVEVKALRPR